MADDKSSDLDVFEGLTKKKKSSTIPPASGTPSSKLPPPRSKKPSSGLPMPTPPPSKRPASSGALPVPKPPPSRDDGPAVSVKPVSKAPPPPREGPVSAAPGVASADLDWDDDEDATSVYDKSSSDIFDDLSPSKRPGSGDSASKRNVAGAAALLASSGRSAQPVRPAASSTPAADPMPRIPAPAPVPRDISDAAAKSAPAEAGPPSTAPSPSWAPSKAPPAQSSEGGKSTWILAAVAVLVLVVAGALYLQSSGDAQVAIQVEHKGQIIPTNQPAQIFVDGQKKCDFAPCKLEMSPGDKLVRVVSGKLAGEQRVTVQGGKDAQIRVVLQDADPTSLPPQPDTPAPVSDEPATLELASAMKKDIEIEVTVDGEKKGKLPLKLEELKAGEHELEFSGPDKYGKLVKTIELQGGKTKSIKDIELPLEEVEVEFVLATKGAVVKLIKDGEEKDAETLTFKADKAEAMLDTDHKWKVVAKLKSFEDFEKTLDFSDAEEGELKLEIKLEKSTEPSEVATTNTPGPQPASTDKPDPAPPSPSEFGIINANSLPPSKVMIDGRPRGSTPVAGVRVPAGPHSVLFRHSKYGVQSRSVTVGPGQTKTVTVRFKKKD